MTKKIILIICLLITIIIPLSSKSQIYQITTNLEYSYDTNVFSSPLPLYDDDNTWLPWREKNPFIKKHQIGANINFSFYNSLQSRVGFTSSFAFDVPLNTIVITPTQKEENGFTSGQWDYIQSNANSSQNTSIWGALGISFRAPFKTSDLGINIKLSLGTYDSTENDIILGIQAEPYYDIFIGNNCFIDIRMTYDAHLMRFIQDSDKKFDEHYQMLSVAPSIGFGYRF